MKRIKKRYIVILLIIVSLLSVVWFYWLNPKKALEFALPDLNELSYVNAKIKSDTAYIELIGIIENKAPYKITIDSLAYNLDLAGNRIISEDQNVGIELLSGEKDTIMLTFRIPISKTRGIIQKLQSKDSTSITANFEITYNTIFGRTTFPYSKDIDIKVPNPPEIKLIKVKAGELNLKNKNIDIDLAISIKNNSDKIELRLRDLDYTAKLGKNIAGKGKYSKLIIIKPLSTAYVTLPINVIIDKPLRTFWKVAAKKEFMPYEINMDAVLINDTLQDVPISINAIGNTQLIK